jgi:outer membrane protein OmpA-like peptidoglycan-associated protein
MRIHIAGFVLFVIWCFISAWLYNDMIMPGMKKSTPIQTIPKTLINEADSLMKLKASMPENLVIYFEFNGTKFKPDVQIENSITTLTAWLGKYQGSMLNITGHTDLVGTIEYNYNLGLKRAEVVEKYLENKGINASSMIIESKGETEPAADYLTEEGRAKNRRTEISIKMQ